MHTVHKYILCFLFFFTFDEKLNYIDNNNNVDAMKYVSVKQFLLDKKNHCPVIFPYFHRYFSPNLLFS